MSVASHWECCSSKNLIPLFCLGVMLWTSNAQGYLFRYADFIVAIDPGPGQMRGFTDETVVIGPPANHLPDAPGNRDPDTGQATVFSLGQGGSVTLGFKGRAPNQAPSPANPYGYDLLVVGNAFQAPTATVPPNNELADFRNLRSSRSRSMTEAAHPISGS